MRSIDLNADLGEGYGVWTSSDDLTLLNVVTSANVACGGHAGDPWVMRRTCEAAVEQGVRIGAHVGYADVQGFGRREIGLRPSELEDLVLWQIGGLAQIAKAAGSAVEYVKLHGALYHRALRDREAADAVAGAISEVRDDFPVPVPPGASALRHAIDAAGLRPVVEAFADRAYLADGSLAPRSRQGSVLDAESRIRQALSLVRDSRVCSIDGETIAVEAETICLHGDAPDAAAAAERLAVVLAEANVALEAFA